jgi:hypothetical protein
MGLYGCGIVSLILGRDVTFQESRPALAIFIRLFLAASWAVALFALGFLVDAAGARQARKPSDSPASTRPDPAGEPPPSP